MPGDVPAWCCPVCEHPWSCHQAQGPGSQNGPEDGEVVPCWQVAGVTAEGKDDPCGCTEPYPAEGMPWPTS